jgi:hypothetical protein
MKLALQVILGISAFGVVFSGALTIDELFGQSALSCPAPGAPGTVLGYPACVYGLLMYMAIAATATAGLISGRRAGNNIHVTNGRSNLSGPLSSA